MGHYIVCSVDGYVKYDGTHAEDLTVVGVARDAINEEYAISQALDISPMSREYWEGKELYVYELSPGPDGKALPEVRNYHQEDEPNRVHDDQATLTQ